MTCADWGLNLALALTAAAPALAEPLPFEIDYGHTIAAHLIGDQVRIEIDVLAHAALAP